MSGAMSSGRGFIASCGTSSATKERRGAEMPGKTHGEKIDELGKLVAALGVRVDFLQAELADVKAEQSRMNAELAALTTRVALLEQAVADLRKASDEKARRLW